MAREGIEPAHERPDGLDIWTSPPAVGAFGRASVSRPSNLFMIDALTEILMNDVDRGDRGSAPPSPAIAASIDPFQDPVLREAIDVLHARPEQTWTVTDLASVANVSRSVLDNRFRQLLGVSPIRYLTDLRMDRARDLLLTTQLVVAAVGRCVGYRSEEAFSRAFRRSCGMPPGAWRTSHVGANICVRGAYG